jgi:hypothetical protein
VQPRESALDQRVVSLDEEDLEAGLGRDLHDARAHEAAPDDADVRDGHGMSRFAGDSSEVMRPLTSERGRAAGAARSGTSPAGTGSSP